MILLLMIILVVLVDIYKLKSPIKISTNTFCLNRIFSTIRTTMDRSVADTTSEKY